MGIRIAEREFRETFTRVGDDVDLVAVRIERTGVLDPSVDLLVDVSDAAGQHVVQLMFQAERRFLLPHRLQVWLDGVRAKRGVTEVDAPLRVRGCRSSANDPARA